MSKRTTVVLKQVPPGYYSAYEDCKSYINEKTFIAQRTIINSFDNLKTIRFLLEYYTNKHQTVSVDIPRQAYETIVDDLRISKITIHYEYIFGKDTIHVFKEEESPGKYFIYATGPIENMEWQYEFQKYKF